MKKKPRKCWCCKRYRIRKVVWIYEQYDGDEDNPGPLTRRYCCQDCIDRMPEL